MTLISSPEYYDKLAEEYRAQDDFWDNQYDREIWRLEHDLIRPYLSDTAPILDVGCGFYPHFDFTYQRTVVAGDISFKSLLVAKNFGDESGSVHLAQFDAISVPFRDQTFDCVLAGGELLNHLSSYQHALAEFRRVLRPNGILLVQVGAKWCLDSLWAILDAFVGHRIGYAVTKQEAFSMLKSADSDVKVTWGITPSGDFQVSLLSITGLLNSLAKLDFHTLCVYGANAISGIIPLPIQQKSHSRLVQLIISALIQIDRVIGHFPLVRTFAGNVFVVCQRTA